MNERLLTLREISISTEVGRKPRLDRFSLHIDRGETVILLGEADAGKTALMRLLAGAVDAGETVRGTLQFGIGVQVAADKLSQFPIRLAYVPGPSARPLSNYTSAAAQLARVIGHKTSISHDSAHAEFGVALARLKGAPPQDVFDRKPNTLSPEVLAWGLLAAGVAATPELLLIDHLLVGLSPIAARALARALRDERDRQGFAILYNALGTEVARWLGGRLIVMRQGRIVEEGPASRLTTTQSHAYTQTLFKPIAPGTGVDTRTGSRGQSVIQAYALELSGGDKLTFELRRGRALALIGEDGSGRHALARRLIGLEATRAGRIVFDAVDIGVLSRGMMARMRRRVAVVAGTDDVLDPRLTVSDTVSEPLRISLDLPRRLVAGYRDKALKRVGLSSLNGDLAVAQLSAFDKRRLQIARAIASAPIVALIDEPLRGLDAFAQSVVRDLLRSFRAEEGTAYLVITSDIAVAQALADEAMIFLAGRVVERGMLADIVSSPREPYTRMLIEAARPVL